MADKNIVRRYILFSLGWSYLFWISAAIISSLYPTWSGIQILHLVGGIGPLTATIYILSQTKNWKAYFSRCINFSDFSLPIWAIVLSPVFISIMGSLIAQGGFTISEAFLNNGILYAVFLLFFGPLPEELGWRGILFDVTSKRSILRAQIITASVWFVWHLPLFFIAGSYQNQVGFGTIGFLLWGLELVIQSVIMGYLYIFSERSIASAILFHYVVNLAGEALVKGINSQILALAFYLVLAFVLGFLNRKEKQKQNPEYHHIAD